VIETRPHHHHHRYF